MDLQAAASAVGSMKAAIELTKTILDAKSQVERQAAVASLQQQLLGAQIQAMEANDAIRSLRLEIDQMKAYIAGLDDWATTSAKYELFSLAPGNVAYRPTHAALANTADHFLCATCFQERKHKVLSVVKMSAGRRSVFTCTGCTGSMIIDGNAPARD